MNQWALAAVDEMIARIDKLSRFAPDVEMVVDRLGPLRSTVVAIRADLEAE